MQEVKDFPDEITGKTYSPIRPTSDDPRRKTNLFSSLVDYGKRRLSMVTGEVLKPPVSESDKRAISHKDFLPPTPEEEKKSRRSSISSLFSKKSNSPSAPSPASARLNFMERGGAIPENRSQSDSEHSGDKEEAIRRLADNIEENLNLSDFEIEGEDEDNPGEGDGRDSSFPQTDGQDNLSKSEFKTHLKQLNRRKKWAENSIRRASDNFVSNYDKTGKAAMDRFIVAMSRGVAVRRHQAGCLAEEVRLYSDNGCHSINWEPPKVHLYTHLY